MRCVSSSSSARAASSDFSSSLRASPSVRPRMRAFRKLVASTSEEFGTSFGMLSRRFSIWPSSETITASARPGSSRTNSICFRRGFVFVAVTTPAPRDKPESSAEASPSTESMLPPRIALTCASMLRRSFSGRSPISRSASTKKRSPCCVGKRPALVCGEKMSPAASRSAITLRTEAGDSCIGIMRERLREPTGSPVARYDSTIWRKISRERSSSSRKA